MPFSRNTRRDHVPIVFHDNDMDKACGLNTSIKDLNADEIVNIALLTVTPDEFKKVQQGVACDLRHKFWFGLPHQLPTEMVKRLQQNGAYVIPAINTFRYPEEGHYE